MPGGSRGPQAGRYTGERPMSFVELQQCSQTVGTLTDLDAGLQSRDQALSTARRAIQSEATQLDFLRGRVDVRKPKQVEQFNARLARHREDIDTFNRQITDFNWDIARLRETRDAFTMRCAGRPYLQKDLARLTPSESASIASVSKVSDAPAYQYEERVAHEF